MCVITMICWGSWANTQKLASKQWKFQLFYWDYSLGVLILTLIFAFTIGSFGDVGRGFIEDLKQADAGSFGSALLGGVVFNLANLLLVAAIDIAGMAVAFPVGIGLALAVGVVTNYLAVPVGNPIVLFIGVFFVVLAIMVDALAYRKLPSKGEKSMKKGLLLSVIAGVAMGFFYRFVAASMSEDMVNPDSGLFTPYSALVIFSIGLLLSSFVFNSILMKKPITGKSVRFKDYFTKGSPRLHMIGILGGIIWSIGMSFSILASGEAGYAISYGLGQGATMVAALWGVFIWKEFKGAPKGTNTLLSMMFIFFVIGLSMIILARVI